ncbi:MAG: AAA family ATPase [Deltaproteobacteria bacterium]|nr:AAA family ATPase [Deltaproteobacteria bacterium]
MNTEMQKELAYLKHFGLEGNPFPVAPDVEHFFLSRDIDRLITEIVHGIVTRKGFMVLTGEVGLGKTTISRKIMKILEEREVQTSLVFHTSYQDVELLREINRDFGLLVDTLEFGDLMKVLRDFLLGQNQEGRNCAILIDDAQNLSPESLELVRMISNLETDQQKLVQILLIGQPELIKKLDSPELRQLKSRIIIKQEARPLSEEELKNYILFKLNVAGNKGNTAITRKAVRRIFRLTGGNLRQVNTVMDRILYVAFLRNSTKISQEVVKEAQKDLKPGKAWKKPPLRFRPWLAVPAFCALIAVLFFIPSFHLGHLVKEISAVFFSGPVVTESRADTQQQKPAARQENTAAAASSAWEEKVQAPVFLKEKPVPKALREFLSAYSLTKFARAFDRAMENGDFKELSRDILRETGYQLVTLKKLPESVREKYGVLICPASRGSGNEYFLFWRPRLLIHKFYYGYRGQEIVKLQELLANAHCYREPVDGIVGSGLMRAVLDFQKRMGIEVTGYPDRLTVFLLHVQENWA